MDLGVVTDVGQSVALLALCAANWVQVRINAGVERRLRQLEERA